MIPVDSIYLFSCSNKHTTHSKLVLEHNYSNTTVTETLQININRIKHYTPSTSAPCIAKNLIQVQKTVNSCKKNYKFLHNQADNLTVTNNKSKIILIKVVIPSIIFHISERVSSIRDQIKRNIRYLCCKPCGRNNKIGFCLLTSIYIVFNSVFYDSINPA